MRRHVLLLDGEQYRIGVVGTLKAIEVTPRRCLTPGISCGAKRPQLHAVVSRRYEHQASCAKQNTMAFPVPQRSLVCASLLVRPQCR